MSIVSQVMASVLSMQQGWSEAEQPKFEGELTVGRLGLTAL